MLDLEKEWEQPFGYSLFLIQDQQLKCLIDYHYKVGNITDQPLFSFLLEFDQQVEVNPVFAGLDPPDDIAFALPQVVADVMTGAFLQGVEVEAVQPVVGNKTEDQVTHHLGCREQEFIAGVVVGAHRGSVAD